MMRRASRDIEVFSPEVLMARPALLSYVLPAVLQAMWRSLGPTVLLQAQLLRARVLRARMLRAGVLRARLLRHVPVLLRADLPVDG